MKHQLLEIANEHFNNSKDIDTLKKEWNIDDDVINQAIYFAEYARAAVAS